MKLTIFLILLNVSAFLLTSNGIFISEDYAQEYGFSMKNFFEGKYYTLFTSIFLHADILHLIFNMAALFVLGWAVESKVSKVKYIITYFLGGIFGNLFMLIPFFGYSYETLAVGASAAISALIGLGTFICPGKLVFFPSIIPIPFMLAGAIYFLVTLSGLFEISQIAYPAHLGGMLVGGVLGLIWGESRILRIILFILTCLAIIFIPSLIIRVLK